MTAAAPLSKPTTSRKPLKRTATPSMSQSQRGKRPRPSNDDIEPLKKKDLNSNFLNGPGTSASASSLNGLSNNASNSINNLNSEGNAMRKGMYLAFIDDAFTKRNKVRFAFNLITPFFFFSYCSFKWEVMRSLGS